MASPTPARLEALRDKTESAIERQLDGLAEVGEDDRFYREAKIADLGNLYTMFARKAFRSRYMAHEIGKHQ